MTAAIESRPYYKFPPETIEIVRTYIASCTAMIRQKSEPQVLSEILRLLARAFFLGAGNTLSRLHEPYSIGPYSPLAEAFLSLVERNFRKNRKLEYYAGLLGRSPKYLSRHIKEQTGQNATGWIDRCVIMEAQAQMISTRKTIAEIAYELGFDSPSFFGKYFKRVTGASPLQFRRNIH